MEIHIDKTILTMLRSISSDDTKVADITKEDIACKDIKYYCNISNCETLRSA